MKNIILITLLASSSAQAFSTKESSNKETAAVKYSKVATVHGMVCAFCSNSLEKKLKKEEAIKSIHVDLKNKKVSVELKKGKTISDKILKKLITSSGFKVVAINNYNSLNAGEIFGQK